MAVKTSVFRIFCRSGSMERKKHFLGQSATHERVGGGPIMMPWEADRNLVYWLFPFRATATSFTLVPVGPVMMRPPVFCRAR